MINKNEGLRKIEMQLNIINRINELCNEKGYDYITLAKKSDIPLTTLLNIVKGNSKNPYLYTLAKLCNGLEITLSEFFAKQQMK